MNTPDVEIKKKLLVNFMHPRPWLWLRSPAALEIDEIERGDQVEGVENPWRVFPFQSSITAGAKR